MKPIQNHKPHRKIVISTHIIVSAEEKPIIKINTEVTRFITHNISSPFPTSCSLKYFCILLLKSAGNTFERINVKIITTSAKIKLRSSVISSSLEITHKLVPAVSTADGLEAILPAETV